MTLIKEDYEAMGAWNKGFYGNLLLFETSIENYNINNFSKIELVEDIVKRMPD